MSNIDFSQTITADSRIKYEHAAREASIKTSCAEHISATLDLVTISNIQSAALLGELDREQQVAFSEAQKWIKQTREMCRKHIGDESGLSEDTPIIWPPVPSSVIALAKEF